MFRPFTLNIKGRLREINTPQVMGIVNITPDSFYAGSRTFTADSVMRRVESLLNEGADMIDIGAYSTRQGASEVSAEEEVARLEIGLSAIRTLSTEIPVSVDTFRASVAAEAVGRLNADIVNDISGGNLDEDMFQTVAKLRAPYILTHMRGTPATMQTLAHYNDVTADVINDLSDKIRKLRLSGVSDIIVDPGFGFAKTLEQNYELMRNLEAFTRLLDAPLLVGISRKSMINKALGITPDQALNGTTVLNVIALSRGASILRVHDVKAAKEAVRLYNLSTNR